MNSLWRLLFLFIFSCYFLWCGLIFRCRSTVDVLRPLLFLHVLLPFLFDFAFLLMLFPFSHHIYPMEEKIEKKKNSKLLSELKSARAYVNNNFIFSFVFPFDEQQIEVTLLLCVFISFI